MQENLNNFGLRICYWSKFDAKQTKEANKEEGWTRLGWTRLGWTAAFRVAATFALVGGLYEFCGVPFKLPCKTIN
jgi:hypothetical protein